MKSLLTLLVTLFIVCQQAESQSVPTGVLYKTNTTNSVKDLIRQNAQPKDIPSWQIEEGKYIQNLKKRLFIKEISNKNINFGKSDPAVLQKMNISQTEDVGILINKNGLDRPNVPLDPNGAVGRNHFVMAVNNSEIGVYDKKGILIERFPSNILWDNFGGTFGDPIVLYDVELDRWLITEIRGGNQIKIAASLTGDPLGAYTSYEMVTEHLPDYPKYTIWGDFITLSLSSVIFGADGHVIHFFNKHDMFRGDPEVGMTTNITESRFFQPYPLLLHAAHVEGPNEPLTPYPILFELNDTNGQNPDGIYLQEYIPDFNQPDSTFYTEQFIESAEMNTSICPFLDVFSCIPQKDGEKISGASNRIMNKPIYRNFDSHESIVLCMVDIVDGQEGCGVRWMEIRRTDVSEGWTLYQEGTYAFNDGLYRFLPSMTIDEEGAIMLAYSVSSPDDYVGLRMTGRYADDPLGQMTIPETELVKGKSHINTQRYGDYASFSFDPLNGKLAWFVSEYADENNNPRSRMVSCIISRDSFDLECLRFDNIASSGDLTNNELAQIEIRNNGLNISNTYLTQLFVDEILHEEILVSEAIASDSIKMINFENPIDLSQKGEYEFMMVVTDLNDENRLNDTIKSTIVHRRQFETNVLVNQILFTECGSTKGFELEIVNSGAQDVVSGQIIVELNDQVIDTRFWNTLIPSLESRIFTYDLKNLVLEENEIRFTFVNTAEEEITDNNSASMVFYKENLNVEMTLVFFTDSNPEETTWEIIHHDTQEVIYAGGPYIESNSLVEELLCLNPEDCYTFYLYDSGGNGIENSLYTINYPENITYILGLGQSFEYFSEDSFCPSHQDCELEGNTVVTEDNESYTIELNVTNSDSPFLYTIDDGINFQSSNIFTQIPAGTHLIKAIEEDGNCQFEKLISLNTSVNVFEFDDFNWDIFPNPFTSEIILEVPSRIYQGQPIHYSIIDAQGKNHINPISISKNSERISLEHLASGTYFIKISNGSKSSLKKLIKI